MTGFFSNAASFSISIILTKQNRTLSIAFYQNPLIDLNLFLIQSLFLYPIIVETVCGKKDWGIRTGKSDIKFERITELEIENEQIFIEFVIKQGQMMVWTWKCGI